MHPQLSLLLCEKAEVIYTMSQKLAQTKTPCASVFPVPHAASKVLHARHKPLTLASSSPLNLCCMYLFNRTTSHTCHLICLIFPHVKPNRDSIPCRYHHISIQCHISINYDWPDLSPICKLDPVRNVNQFVDQGIDTFTYLYPTPFLG